MLSVLSWHKTNTGRVFFSFSFFPGTFMVLVMPRLPKVANTTSQFFPMWTEHRSSIVLCLFFIPSAVFSRFLGPARKNGRGNKGEIGLVRGAALRCAKPLPYFSTCCFPLCALTNRTPGGANFADKLMHLFWQKRAPKINSTYRE